LRNIFHGGKIIHFSVGSVILESLNDALQLQELNNLKIILRD